MRVGLTAIPLHRSKLPNRLWRGCVEIEQWRSPIVAGPCAVRADPAWPSRAVAALDRCLAVSSTVRVTMHP